jgi:hypothetical protein
MLPVKFSPFSRTISQGTVFLLTLTVVSNFLQLNVGCGAFNSLLFSFSNLQWLAQARSYEPKSPNLSS